MIGNLDIKAMIRERANQELERLSAGKLKLPDQGKRAVAQIASPIPEADRMDQLDFQPSPDMIASLERVRREKPEYKGSDAQFYSLHNRYGDELLSALPSPTPTRQPSPTPTPTPSIPAGVVSSTPQQYTGLITEAAKTHGVPERLLSALLQTESSFNPNAKSPVGALGIAQFMPGTAKGLGINPLDPKQAIPAAAQYLRRSFDKFGSWELALAAYNAGGGAVSAYGGIPPFKETQNHVRKIMGMATEEDYGN